MKPIKKMKLYGFNNFNKDIEFLTFMIFAIRIPKLKNGSILNTLMKCIMHNG